jgi:RluA family pseudouridine synthase
MFAGGHGVHAYNRACSIDRLRDMYVAHATVKAPAPALDFARWIVWEDEGLLAIDKPAGVLSQGGEGGQGVNVVDLARAYLGREGIGVLHRIDRNVSGVVLVAKQPSAASAMTRLIQKGGLERVYRAVVRGSPAADALHIDALLAKDATTNEVRAATAEAVARMPAEARRDFRPASTDVKVVARLRAPIGACASLDVRPISGRSHQIRVHLAHVGLPILGDPKYGVLVRGLNRPLLHAMRVAFVHPRTRARILIEARVPWTEAMVAGARSP